MAASGRLPSNRLAAPGRPVYTAVLEDLRQRLRRGDWLPGARLPSISQLACELQVGTGSVREALRSLQSMGLVTIEHGRGVFASGARGPSGLDRHFEQGGAGLMLALAETRRILEPELSALASERGTDSELAHIAALARDMETQAEQGQDFAQPDVEFHQHIARAARNAVLYQIMDSLSDLFLQSRRLTALEPGMTARAVRYHLLIADALLARNAPQARLVMLAHMNDALSGVLVAESRVRSAGGG